MTSKPPIRNCPICRIAMLASRENPASAGFDTFRCLTCETVIHIDESASAPLTPEASAAAKLRAKQRQKAPVSRQPRLPPIPR